MIKPLKPINVALVEDDSGLRSSLELMLKRAVGLKWTRSFTSAEDAITRVAEQLPDVLLMDINLPGMSGIECVRNIKKAFPMLQIIMITVYDHSHAVFESLAAGASGFLLKPVRAAELTRAVVEVHAGGSPMTPNIARLVVQTFQQTTARPDPASELSLRERQVLNLLSQGLLQKEIAGQLSISYHTVQTYTARIYEKLHVRSRAQAVAKYLGATPPS